MVDDVDATLEQEHLSARIPPDIQIPERMATILSGQMLLKRP